MTLDFETSSINAIDTLERVAITSGVVVTVESLDLPQGIELVEEELEAYQRVETILIDNLVLPRPVDLNLDEDEEGFSGSGKFLRAVLISLLRCIIQRCRCWKRG